MGLLLEIFEEFVLEFAVLLLLFIDCNLKSFKGVESLGYYLYDGKLILKINKESFQTLA